MVKNLLLTLFIFSLISLPVFAQTNEWITQYVLYDDAANGPGYQVSSAAAVGSNNFVALVNQVPASGYVWPAIFTPAGNYLVGYWAADSGAGRVPSPINGQQTAPAYGGDNQFTDWSYILDQVTLSGAWQLAKDGSDRVYVANNDPNHNILVFSLTGLGLFSTEYRMETGLEDIFAIDLDTAGYVYVADFQGTAGKTNEIKVFAGIDAPGTTWGTVGVHNDAPVSTVDLPEGYYQGLAVSSDGTEIFVSHSSARSILKYVGDPMSGYSPDPSFSYSMAANDTVANGGDGVPSVLGLAYMPDPQLLIAAVDTFAFIGTGGGYPYGRMYIFNSATAEPLDTIDVAEWNLAVTGAYNTGSSNGRAGGFTSIMDVDVVASEQAIYSQSYYGWTVEKWIFDGDLNAFVAISPVSMQVPEGFNLKQNYPNPFNPLTTIEFAIEKSATVKLEVINVRGQQVATLVNQPMTAGTYRATFDAKYLPSGVYFYRMTAGDYSIVRKMTLMK